MKNSYIHIQELSYSINSVPLYDDISAHIKAGDKAVLLGANGSGKSTLFRCITGEISDYHGICQSHGLVFTVDQEISFFSGETVHQRLSRNYPLHEHRQFHLGLQNFGLDDKIDVTIEHLSGGQRKKLQFVATDFLEADILLLDEPTNHLDQLGLLRLQDFCKSRKGPLLCISHERAFIDAIATHIFALENQQLIPYVGNYSGYIERKEQYDLAKRKEYEAQQRDKKAMEQRLADLRQRASVYVNPARGKLLKSKEKAFERQFLGEQAIEKPKAQIVMELGQGDGVKGEKRILQRKKQDVSITIPRVSSFSFTETSPSQKILFQLPAGEIRGRERIHLKGPNGCGKSTLLKIIYQQYNSTGTKIGNQSFLPDKGGGPLAVEGLKNDQKLFSRGPNIRILYLDQFGLDIITSKSVRQRSLEHFPNTRSESDIRAKLQGAGISADHLKTSLQDLSFGQRTKIRFLEMMAHGYDLLLLDEPTNHLDIPTKEMFEEMLQNYQGSVIIISHDQWTLNQIGITQVWEIKDEKLTIKELFNTV